MYLERIGPAQSLEGDYAKNGTGRIGAKLWCYCTPAGYLGSLVEWVDRKDDAGVIGPIHLYKLVSTKEA
jgi:hypothetical protein